MWKCNSTDDGFDEFSLIHTHKSAAILFELMKSKVGGDLVTLRNVERLGKELSGITFSTKNLSRESQRECSQPLDI